MSNEIDSVRFNKIMYRDRFCNVPFRDVKIKDNGDVYFCAWSDQMGMPPLGNIFKTENLIHDIWNGKIAQEFRMAIINGSFKFCGDYCCHLISATGPVTKKKDTIKNINDYFTQGINNYEQECIKNKITFLKTLPKNIILATTSKCNLKCVSCRRDFITKDHKTKEEWKLLEIRRKQFIEKAETIFIGSYGEVTVNKLETNMLHNYTNRELRNIKKIVIQTNGILFTRKYWEKINDFIKSKIERIEISVDAATEETYAKNRPGGNWKKLWKNIEFLSKLHKPWIQLNFVVQNNNYLEIIPFIKLVKKYNITAHFQLLYNWGSFSDAEFIERDVLNPKHKNYSDLIKILSCDEFAGDNVINDLALGKGFDKALGNYKKNIKRKQIAMPFIIYKQSKQCGYKLMGSKDGVSLSVETNYIDDGGYVMKLESNGNEDWAGIYFLISEVFDLKDRSKSVEFIEPTKLKVVMKAAEDIHIDEIGFGERTDSFYTNIKNVILRTQYSSFEIDLSGKDLSNINGLFYVSLKSNYRWKIFIKEIVIC